MNCLDFHRLAHALLKNLRDEFRERIVPVLVPTRRNRADMKRKACKFCQILRHAAKFKELAFHAGTRIKVDVDVRTLHAHDAEIRRGFHHARRDGGHLVDARMEKAQDAQQVCCILWRKSLLCMRRFCK